MLVSDVQSLCSLHFHHRCLLRLMLIVLEHPINPPPHHQTHTHTHTHTLTHTHTQSVGQALTLFAREPSRSASLKGWSLGQWHLPISLSPFLSVTLPSPFSLSLPLFLSVSLPSLSLSFCLSSLISLSILFLSLITSSPSMTCFFRVTLCNHLFNPLPQSLSFLLLLLFFFFLFSLSLSVLSVDSPL